MRDVITQLWVRTAFFIAFGALVAILCANCSAGGAGSPDSGADVTTNVCGNGNYALCGSACVDIKGDSHNCGTCGNACPGSQVCSHGECSDVCGGGTSRCNNNCVDLTSDVNNCGGCGKPCPGGEVCSKGTCALTCQSGLTDCTGDCVDVTQDDANCGACGNACAGGQVCVDSQCQATCQSGWTTCPVGDSGTTCVDIENDPNNCNGCGKTCPNGYFCVAGACGLKCAGGTTKCGTGLSETCVDENIDPNHCGSCTTVCGTGKVCSNANCCPTATPYYCGGCNTFANCVQKEGGYIVAGYDHTCAINTSGAAYCWGDNSDGQIGTNDSTTFSYDTAQAVFGLSSGVFSLGADGFGTCAISTGGAISCWGDDFDGELGDNTTTFGEQYAPVASGITSNGIHVSGSGDATCYLLGSGAVDCAGYDGSYEIANGLTPSFMDYVTPSSTLITSGTLTIAGSTDGEGNMFCAVASSGGVKCWGSQFNGSLGDGSTTQSSTPISVSGISTATNVSTAYSHACAVLSTGGLECWGDNTYGELGNGKTSTTPSSTPVTATVTGVSQVATGFDTSGFAGFTCVLTTAGAVECVGYNASGELGNGKTATSKAWVTPIASGAIGIAAGGGHACALLATGKVQCWGNNSSGQVGNGTFTNSKVPVTVMGF
jgi:alpha-tubulin suppressor-like RCC1 family protein